MCYANSMTSLISFLSGPIAPIYKKLELAQLPEVPDEGFYSAEFNDLVGTELVPESVQAKLDSFIRQFDLDPAQFICLVKPEPKCRLTDSMGSIRGGNKGVIFFDPRMVHHIDKEFSKALQFAVARALSSFIHDDHYTAHHQMVQDVSTVRVVAYGVTMAAASVLLPLSLPVAHLASCVASYGAGMAREMQLTKALGLKADLWTAAQSIKLARGGLVLIDIFKRTNLQIVKLMKMDCDLLEQPDKPLHTRLIGKFARLATGCMVNWKGENRLDFYHPALDARQAEIARVLKNSK